MKRQIILSAALLAGLLLFAGASDAQAFHFKHRGGCGCEPSCCAPEPTCCDAAPSCCGKKRHFAGLFHKFKNRCCQPACGCEATCEATCAAAPNCAAPVEPSCAAPVEASCCAAAPSCCEPSCCGKKRHFAGLFHKFKNRCCQPACGCEATCAAEPTCGCN